MLEFFKKILTSTTRKLTNAEEVNEKAVEKTSNQLNRMKETLRDTERNLSLTEAEMRNLSNETESVNAALKKNELEQYTKKLKDLSENLNSLGGNLMKLSSPLLAFSGYSAKVAMDFEESMSNVAALSGATSDDLEKLSDAAKEMGASISKSAKESAIGGKTQLDTLQALLSGLNEEYVDLKATITDSDGALNKLAQTMQDNAKGNVTKLKSQLEGLGIQIGNYLLPHINRLLEHLSNLITWFGNLDESAQKSTVQFGFRTFVGGGLLKGIGSLTQKK